MLIKELFDRDIARKINPAVVVADQKEETIFTEIDEYVFTDDVITNLFRFLYAIKEEKHVDKTGIWVNGYYGSGKSHFIKYVHYCLNKKTSVQAFGRFLLAVKEYNSLIAGNDERITPSNVQRLMQWYEKAEIDDILFNIEDVADDHKGERLTRVFLSMFNNHRGYNSYDIPLAILFEKYLDQHGVLDTFSRRLQDEHGFDWKTQAADVKSFELQTILTLAHELCPSLDMSSLRVTLENPETYRITIQNLCAEIQEYIRNKEGDYRLVFLVDEMSQYVGRNRELLLNLENIVERLSIDCNKKVWVACTAQQTLESVSRDTGIGERDDEFGKILGRFETRISLESTDAGYITQKRILDKSSKGVEALGKLYHADRDAVELQFRLNHDLYKGYRSEEEFTLSYPFVPYQFKMIAHVFDAFQNLQYVIKEVKDNERSVIGITSFTIQRHADSKVGEFIPFDAFFNDLFTSNLTHSGRRAFEIAESHQVTGQEEFASRVVRTLFMISNFPKPVQVTFPPHVENLAILMMTRLDQNKLQLQTQIKGVLDKLLEHHIVREERGSYFFFTEEEIAVSRLIDAKMVNSDFRSDKINDLLADKHLLNINNKKLRLGSSDFALGMRVDDKEFYRGGNINVAFIIHDQGDVYQKALSNSTDTLLFCLYEQMNADPTLLHDIDRYCKAEKYFLEDSDSMSGQRANTNEIFKERNRELKVKLVQRLGEKLKETKVISGQKVFESWDLPAGDAKEKYQYVLQKHLESVYGMNSAASGYAQTAADLRAALKAGLQKATGLTTAEGILEDYLSAQQLIPNLADVIHHFSKPPFGWKDIPVIHIACQLARNGRRELKYRNEPMIDIAEFAEKAIKANERNGCQITPGAQIDAAVLRDAIAAYRTVFNDAIADTVDAPEAFILLMQGLTSHLDNFRKQEELYLGKYPFGERYKHLCARLQEWIRIREPKRFFDQMIAQSDETKAMVDGCREMTDFISRHQSDYDQVREFIRIQRENFSSLSPEGQEKAKRISDYFSQDSPVRDFRHIRKAAEEMKNEISGYIDTLRKETTGRYADIFRALQTHAAQTGADTGGISNSQTEMLGKIAQEENITRLQLYQSDADHFKAEQLQQLLSKNTDGKKQLAVYKTPQELIDNQKSLDDYLQRIRQEVTTLLQDDKTVMIR